MRLLLLLAALLAAPAAGCARADAGQFPWAHRPAGRPPDMASASLSSTVLGLSPTAYWRFVSNTGAEVDATGNGHTATKVGTGATEVAALAPSDSGALRDNTFQSWTITGIASAGAFSVLWMMLEPVLAGTNGWKCSPFSDAGAAHFVNAYGDQANLDFGTGSIADPSTMTANTAYMFLITRDGSNNLKLYRNGSLVASGVSWSGTWTIGYLWLPGTGSPCDAVWSNQAIWSGTALSSTDAANLWAAGH